MLKKLSVFVLAALLAASMAACSGNGGNSSAASSQSAQNSAASTASAAQSGNSSSASSVTTTINTSSGGKLDTADLFTDRDLTQTADLTDAKSYTLSDGKTITINAEGVYVISGTASNASIVVDAADTDKVQLVLDNANITNSSTPAIYVKSADKVFVTTAEGSTNTLSVTGTFSADGETNTDAVIFSKDDLVLNGLGTLNIQSTNNGISCKDDLKVTGGTINIECSSDGLEANDSISIADGNITINTAKDGIHSENDEDNSQGSVYICGGTITVNAGSDAIQGTTVVQIDNGSLTLSGGECIEATYVQINGGTINISASDDGINGSGKSSAYSTTVEITGGDITIVMGQGDTDGIDSNGDIYIRGGNINITGQSACDYDGKAEKTGGTLIVNGVETDTIPNQMMGGGGMGSGRGGMQPGGNMPGGNFGF